MTTIKEIGGTVNFKADVPCHKAPAIIREFKRRNGEVWYLLSNNRVTKKEAYESMWCPKKSSVNWSGKDRSLDGRHIQ